MAFPVGILSAPLPWLAFIVSKIFRMKRPPHPTEGSRKDKPYRRTPTRRKIKITRAGAWYISALLLIGFAAINTGNNLLYLVVAMLLSLIIISGILSESTLRGLRVKRTPPRHVYPNRDVLIKMTVTNAKKIFPSYSFNIEEAPLKKERKDFSHRPGYVLKIAPSGEVTCFGEYRFKRRGIVKLRRVTIKTRFPFGLLLKSKTTDAPSELIVYPETRPLADKEPPLMTNTGARRLPRIGSGIELYGLREYRPGDDSRHIDWKASARTRNTMQREFEEENDKKLTVVFNNLQDTEASFELAVIRAASLAKEYLAKDYSVALNTLSGNLPHAKGLGQLEKILHTLALIKSVKKRGGANVDVRAN
ncbi:MAG: DUF58 domain-containing protein [Deltaproteobacteria bacterium]|nr:DUF58 domain-containing protein [Deltaproteobacteria bacterium]